MPKRPVTDNLCIRQRALNTRVHEAFVNNVKFEDIKNTAAASELDKLFKIDLAAKYQDVEYILNVLKSANSLYTIRALKKSPWLFDNDHTQIINPEYLHKKIFPFTSLKMKRKILTHISLHVRNEERAASFYAYCVETKLAHIALKFLVFTSEEFKLTLLTEKKTPITLLVDRDLTYLIFFLKKSFTLLTALLDLTESDRKRRELLLKFHFWYIYDPNKYLDIFEKYEGSILKHGFSDIIMKKHKERVLAKPNFYIKLLSQDVLVKYSTAEDAKVYAIALLPPAFESFWYSNYYSVNSYFLKLIPYEETYTFLKKIYNDRYPGKEFETTKEFYDQEYYIFMTDEQKEAWAWNHIKSEKEILGVGSDYKWYGFVNFKDAFETLKKLATVTKDLEIRTEILKTFIYSAKTNNDLETLLCYYYNRHLNEPRHFKACFLGKIISKHNVYEFNESCWNAFYNLLLTMDIYNTLDCEDRTFRSINNQYKTVALLFYIVNEIDMPDLLNQYALNDFEVNAIRDHLDNLSDKKRTILYEYLHSMYTNKMYEYKNVPFARTDEEKIQQHFNKLFLLMKIYHEVTEPYKKLVSSCKPKLRYKNTNLSDKELVRRLKKDSYLVIDALPEIAEKFENQPFIINTFLKKIKLYFADDISRNYFELFEKNISKDLSQKGIDAAVNGIFHLADENYKISFMTTYAPDNKIDYKEMDAHKLRIQKAIWRYFCRSRPPVPLENVMMYLKSDYVKHCQHIFQMFHANLSLPQCLSFVEALIDTPVSVQKHGIRLAFKCFDTKSLKTLITNTWKRSKNVSLRAVIYKALIYKVQDVCEKQLFEALKTFTLDLGPHDEPEIFHFISSNQLAEEFLGEYYEAAWISVSKFKNKEPYLQWKKEIIKNIRKHLPLMDEIFVREIINVHLEESFRENKLKAMYSDQKVKDLLKEKWILVEAFIIYTTSHSRTPIAFVTLTTYITQVCIENWTEVHSDRLIFQNLCFDFIRGLKREGNSRKDCDPINAVPIFETILTELQSKLPLPEIYLQFLDLNFTIIYKKVIHEEPLNSETCFTFGKEVGKLIVELVKNDKYFTHMVSNIKNVIESHVEDVQKHSVNSDLRISSATCLVKFASGLIEQKIVETYVLAVGILPESFCCYQWQSFQDIISKISEMKDPNVQCAMHLKLRQKFS